MTALDKVYPLFSFFAISIHKQINHIPNVRISFVKLTIKRTNKAISYFGLGASLFPQSNGLILIAKYQGQLSLAQTHFLAQKAQLRASQLSRFIDQATSNRTM
jgi:hypothetical protein